jgi:myxalamid-type polyketide synthase MxaE and MxaD
VRLREASPAERRRLLEGVVAECVAKVLKVAPARVDRRKALGSLGLGSLLAMELRNLLEAALGRSLPATLAWNYPTVTALADHLAEDAAASSPPAAVPAAAAAPARDLGGIAELSDEEAALALRAGRSRGAP